jgi:hypothetical protein
LLKEFPGLTDLEINPVIKGVDYVKGSAIVDFKARWKLNGAPQELNGEVPVVCKGGADYVTPDAILGKADRKIKARIHQRLTGSASTLPEGEVEDGLMAAPAVKGLLPGRQSFGRKATPAGKEDGREPVTEAPRGGATEPTPDKASAPAPDAGGPAHVDTETGGMFGDDDVPPPDYDPTEILRIGNKQYTRAEAETEHKRAFEAMEAAQRAGKDMSKAEKQWKLFDEALK